MPARTASGGQHADKASGPKASGPALKRYLGATVRTADRIDYWIRRHVIDAHVIDAPGEPARLIARGPWSVDAAVRASARQSDDRSWTERPAASKLILACDRRTWLSALGESLKAQYDALAAPVPPRLAALVRQLEAQDQTS